MHIETSFDMVAYLSRMRHDIHNRLDLLIPEQKTAYHILFSAARYSLLQSGKRLRPILTLAIADTFGTHSIKALNAS